MGKSSTSRRPSRQSRVRTPFLMPVVTDLVCTAVRQAAHRMRPAPDLVLPRVLALTPGPCSCGSLLLPRVLARRVETCEQLAEGFHVAGRPRRQVTADEAAAGPASLREALRTAGCEAQPLGAVVG